MSGCIFVLLLFFMVCLASLIHIRDLCVMYLLIVLVVKLIFIVENMKVVRFLLFLLFLLFLIVMNLGGVMKKYYKGIYIYIPTPIYRFVEFDTNKHQGLFKYCAFSNTKITKDCWYAIKKRSVTALKSQGDIVMKFGIFAVENVLEGLSNAVFAFPTNQAAAVALTSQCPHPDEYRIFRIADYNPETREITPVPSELIPMDFRRVRSTSRPETTANDSSAFTDFVQKKDE